ncbi:MAG TPA: glycine oxidase ThiO [Acidimicrobiales bacterium]|nr:glycine oxidase ThiO [Acidimicrobiales bacterium]
MSVTPAGTDVVVVGGGVVGLSVAWMVRRSGRSVVVVDPAPGAGASRAAAGMLAPVTEASAAETPLTALGLTSLRRWPWFAEELATAAGLAGTAALGLRCDGTLQVGFDDDDRRALDELGALHGALGLDSERLTARACRQLVPLLSPRIRGGLLVRGDWQVDPRRVVAALLSALGRAGAAVCRSTAAGLHRRGPAGPVDGVELDDGSVLGAAVVVLAAATGVHALHGLPPELHLPVRPVKGEILRLAAAPGAVELPLTVRATVRGRPVYLVGRADGEVVVGATSQEAGFDTTVRAGAVLELLEAAVDLVPALGELELREATAGLRPATPDNAPLLGPTAVEGLHVATGHYRNGVLLAPVTAEVAVAALDTGRLPDDMAAFAAGRFS